MEVERWLISLIAQVLMPFTIQLSCCVGFFTALFRASNRLAFPPLFSIGGIFPDSCLDESHSQGSRDGDAMMPIFDKILIADLMHKDRWPTALFEGKIGIYPAISQVAFEWTELVIEVILPVQGTDNLLHLDIFHPDKFSVRALAWRLFGE